MVEWSWRGRIAVESISNRSCNRRRSLNGAGYRLLDDEDRDGGELAGAGVGESEDESLVCRWLRQQRLIDDLRRQLCRYRRALAAARRLQTLPAAHSTDEDGTELPPPSSAVQPLTDTDRVTDDEIARYPTSMLPYFTTKRYARDAHYQWLNCKKEVGNGPLSLLLPIPSLSSPLIPCREATP